MAQITLIGHAFFPSGRGEDLRSFFHALSFYGLDPRVIDVFGLNKEKNIKPTTIEHALTRYYSDVNIFFINGDEVDPSFNSLDKLDSNQLNIIFPAWELGNYPKDWAKKLNLFDAIFCSSDFSLKSIEKSVNKPVYYQSFPVVPRINKLKTRKELNLPEFDFLFFSAFDMHSYIDRKNPFDIIKVFDAYIKNNPNENVKLVLKIKEGSKSFMSDNIKLSDIQHIKENQEYLEIAKRIEEKVVLLSNLVDDNDMSNYVMLSDAIISLHRSEGFGRLLAEAMYFKKPVIGTAYSGNLDFMTPENSCLVDFELIDVKEGQYPYYQGQQWANPDNEKALKFMEKLTLDKEYYNKISSNAEKTLFYDYSYNVAAFNMIKNIEKLAKKKLF